MFTGIIESLGRVLGIQNRQGTRRIRVEASQLAGNMQIGDSVAVSGVCLTVVDRDESGFSADLAEETWQRTSFSRIEAGAAVNLELAMRSDARLGGHVVQGHVDGTGVFLGSEEIPGAQDKRIHVEVPPELDPYLVYKGSVAIEGVSLTVAALKGNVLTIAAIPHTLAATNLSLLKPGDPVNIETDVLARYFQKWAATPEQVTPSAPTPRFGIVVSNFNKLITDRLLSEATETLQSHNVPPENIEVVHVPGAYEIPLAAKLLAMSGDFAAIICLGCVIRGETYHFELIANEVARGVGQSALETRVPHAFGVIACDTQEQALARIGLKSGNIGHDAATTALAMSKTAAELSEARKPIVRA